MSTLLEAVVDRWAEVRAENERDKDLIDPEQLKSWESYEAKTTDRLKSIIKNYDGEVLSDSDRDWLKDLGNTMDRAQRVTREELEAQKRARDEAEARRLEEERLRKEAEELKRREVQTVKGRLLGKLGA